MAFITNITSTPITGSYDGDGAISDIKNAHGTIRDGGTIADTGSWSSADVGDSIPSTTITSGIGGVVGAVLGGTFNGNSRDQLQIVLGSQDKIGGVTNSTMDSPNSNSREVADTPLSAKRLTTYQYKQGIRDGNWNVYDGSFTPAPNNVPRGVMDIGLGMRTWTNLSGVEGLNDGYMDLLDTAFQIDLWESRQGIPDGWDNILYSGLPQVLSTGNRDDLAGGTGAPPLPGGGGTPIENPDGSYSSITGYPEYLNTLELVESTGTGLCSTIEDQATQMFFQIPGIALEDPSRFAEQRKKTGTENTNLPIVWHDGSNPVRQPQTAMDTASSNRGDCPRTYWIKVRTTVYVTGSLGPYDYSTRTGENQAYRQYTYCQPAIRPCVCCEASFPGGTAHIYELMPYGEWCTLANRYRDAILNNGGGEIPGTGYREICILHGHDMSISGTGSRWNCGLECDFLHSSYAMCDAAKCSSGEAPSGFPGTSNPCYMWWLCATTSPSDIRFTGDCGGFAPGSHPSTPIY